MRPRATWDVRTATGDFPGSVSRMEFPYLQRVPANVGAARKSLSIQGIVPTGSPRYFGPTRALSKLALIPQGSRKRGYYPAPVIPANTCAQIPEVFQGRMRSFPMLPVRIMVRGYPQLMMLNPKIDVNRLLQTHLGARRPLTSTSRVWDF